MRLNAEQKRRLLQLLAERRTNDEIIAVFQQEYKAEPFHGQIQYHRYCPAHVQRIKELRELYDKELSEEYLASKRNRLKELQRVYEKAMTSAFAGEGTKTGEAIYKFNPKEAIEAIKQAQEEIEGRKMGAEHSGMVTFRVVYDQKPNGNGNGRDS